VKVNFTITQVRVSARTQYAHTGRKWATRIHVRAFTVICTI